MNLISNPIRSGQFYRKNVGNVSWLSQTTYCRRLSEFRIYMWRMAFLFSFSPLTGGFFTSTSCWRVPTRLAAPSEEILRVLDPSWHFVSHQGQMWKSPHEKCPQELEGSSAVINSNTLDGDWYLFCWTLDGPELVGFHRTLKDFRQQ